MASRQSQQRQPTASSAAPTPTQTQTETTPSEPASQNLQPQPAILRLRGVRTSSGPSVRWAEGVVDNEGLGRKSSKVCCIYHPSKGVDESSDESSSSSGSDSGTDSDDSTRGKGKRSRHNHGSGGGKKHDGDCKGDDCSGTGKTNKKKQTTKRAPSPNAYEKIPKVKPRTTMPGGGGALGS